MDLRLPAPYWLLMQATPTPALRGLQESLPLHIVRTTLGGGAGIPSLEYTQSMIWLTVLTAMGNIYHRALTLIFRYGKIIVLCRESYLTVPERWPMLSNSFRQAVLQYYQCASSTSPPTSPLTFYLVPVPKRTLP